MALCCRPSFPRSPRQVAAAPAWDHDAGGRQAGGRLGGSSRCRGRGVPTQAGGTAAAGGQQVGGRRAAAAAVAAAGFLFRRTTTQMDGLPSLPLNLSLPPS